MGLLPRGGRARRPTSGTAAASWRADLRADLRREGRRSTLAGEQGFLDYPVVGSVMFALAEWELTGDPDPAAAERAVRLLVVADLFGYNRQLPSLSWAPAAAMAEAALPGVLARIRAEIGVTPAGARAEERLVASDGT